MSEVTYREANEADLPAVAAMYEELDTFLRRFPYHFPKVENVGELWADTFRRTLGRFTVVIVAEYEGELAGFILGRVKRVPQYMGGMLVGELCDMWVSPTIRCHGMGEKLLRLCTEWLQDQDVFSVEARMLVGNEPIVRRVMSLGFKPELSQYRLVWEDFTRTPDS
jgi:ribosomal protein S18 acetylase RimI-like enzyme